MMFTDLEEAYKIAEELQIKYGLDQIDKRFVHEACRAEGKSMVSISSIAGSVAGQ
jgi:hypothetical protein